MWFPPLNLLRLALCKSSFEYFVTKTYIDSSPDAFASERELPSVNLIFVWNPLLILYYLFRYVVGLMLAPDRPHATVVTLEKSFPKEDDSELK